MNYSLLTNCFCGLDSAEIESKIIDGYDDITKGLINYQIFDSSCVLVLGTVLKFNQTSFLNEQILNELAFTNPVSNELKFIGNELITEIEITNISGKSYVFNSESPNVFDIHSLPQGLYFLTSANNQNVNYKLLKL